MSLRLRLEERNTKFEIPFSRRQGRSDADVLIYLLLRSIPTHPTKAVLVRGMELELHPMPEEEEEYYCNDMKNPPVRS
jgi:hypothetical protein